jgi:hypothetical protein
MWIGTQLAAIAKLVSASLIAVSLIAGMPHTRENRTGRTNPRQMVFAHYRGLLVPLAEREGVPRHRALVYLIDDVLLR